MEYGFGDELPPIGEEEEVGEVSLTERVAELESLCDGLLNVLSNVQAQVEALAAAAPAAGSDTSDDDDDSEETSEYAAYCWRFASEEQKKQLWAQLRDWVDWANATLCSHSWQFIRPCWFRHPAAVEELTALWAAWEAAYRIGDAEFTDAAAYWHERFHTAVRRLWETEFSECLRGHQEPEFDAGSRRTGDDFDQFIQQK